MPLLTLDTYDFIQGLHSAGIPEGQAKAIADGLKKVNLENVATKENILELRSEIDGLRVEIRDMKISLLMWMIPLLLGQVAVFAGLVKWL